MPSVNPGESKQHYLSRCVKYVMDEGKTDNNKQAYAICVGLWNEHKKKSKSDNKFIDAISDKIDEIK